MPPEDSLPAAQARLQAHLAGILDVALDCIVTIDHAGRFIDFNPAAERTFGYPRTAVLGREMTDLIVPPALRAGHRAGMARVLGGAAPKMLGQRIEITAMRADGTEFPVELAITRIATDGPPIFTAHLRDITERKRTEDELLTLQRDLARLVDERTAELARANAALAASAASQRESQSYFAKSFHSSPALMSIARAADGTIIEANPAFLNGSGYPREEVIGRTTLQLGLWLHADQRDEFIRRLRPAKTKRESRRAHRSCSNARPPEDSTMLCGSTMACPSPPRPTHRPICPRLHTVNSARTCAHADCCAKPTTRRTTATLHSSAARLPRNRQS